MSGTHSKFTVSQHYYLGIKKAYLNFLSVFFFFETMKTILRPRELDTV